MPHVSEAVSEAARSFDDPDADGVVLLPNARGSYLGTQSQGAMFEVLDDHSAVVLVHPVEPRAAVPGIPPSAADFLLDTSRAAFLLVRNGILRRYPGIRFVLSHAGGFVPFASHRMAATIAGLTDNNLPDAFKDFESFHFDTALSGSPAALPSLLAFAVADRAATGPTHPPAWSSTSPAVWTPTPAWTPPHAPGSTETTPRPCSPGLPLHGRRSAFTGPAPPGPPPGSPEHRPRQRIHPSM
jgi:hypothetical protein